MLDMFAVSSDLRLPSHLLRLSCLWLFCFLSFRWPSFSASSFSAFLFRVCFSALLPPSYPFHYHTISVADYQPRTFFANQGDNHLHPNFKPKVPKAAEVILSLPYPSYFHLYPASNSSLSSTKSHLSSAQSTIQPIRLRHNDIPWPWSCLLLPITLSLLHTFHHLLHLLHFPPYHPQ